MHTLVLTAVGPDRPGLVDRLSAAVAQHHASVADSRMVNLAGQFALVMQVAAPDDAVTRLKQDLPAVADQIGLNALITDAAAPTARVGVPYRIRTYAMDQVGLVHQITHALGKLGVNIEDLTTQLDHGPHTGTPLFSMDMVVTLPPEVTLKTVRDGLETLCAQLNCDLDIDPA